MKKIKFRCSEDLTEENITIFKNEINEIRKNNKGQTPLFENVEPHKFDSIESFIDYYGLMSFDEFDKKFREE